MTGNKSVHVHFICTGNAYRSRLAEAYLLSLKTPYVSASSSGIEASKHENGPICWYAVRIAYFQNFLPHLSNVKQDTTIHHVNSSDVTVFMHADTYEMYKNKFTKDPKKYFVWDIPDLSHLGFTKKPDSEKTEKEMVRATELTFEKIKAQVQALIKNLQSA